MREPELVLNYPVEKVEISQPFGEDNSYHPLRSGFYQLFNNRHPGVDFSLDENTPVLAAYPGIVVRKENHDGMGNVLGLRYGNIVILYAHLNSFRVDLGDIVSIGQVVGLSGNTGKATTAPHLHFEIRDITKSRLLEMVFDPPFGKTIPNQILTFSYQIKNENTTKTWNSLSRRYFGTERFAQTIRIANPQIKIESAEEVLPEGSEVTIPNYK